MQPVSKPGQERVFTQHGGFATTGYQSPTGKSSSSAPAARSTDDAVQAVVQNLDRQLSQVRVSPQSLSSKALIQLTNEIVDTKDELLIQKMCLVFTGCKGDEPIPTAGSPPRPPKQPSMTPLQNAYQSAMNEALKSAPNASRASASTSTSSNRASSASTSSSSSTASPTRSSVSSTVSSTSSIPASAVGAGAPVASAAAAAVNAPPGLPNMKPGLTNVCYLNSVLQNLFSSNTIIEKITDLSDRYVARAGEDNRDIDARVEIHNELHKVYNAYKKKQDMQKPLEELDKVIRQSQLIPGFTPANKGRQGDAHEVMECLLKVLGIGFQLSTEVSGKNINQQRLPLEKIVSNENFLRVSSSRNKFGSLELLINSNKQLQNGRIHGEDASEVEERQSIAKTPSILNIHIQRAANSQQVPVPLDGGGVFVDNVQNINHDPVLFNPNGYVNVTLSGHPENYRILSGTVHSGQDNAGHYIAVVRRDNNWFMCNDNIVNQISEADALKQLEQCSDLILEKEKPQDL